MNVVARAKRSAHARAALALISGAVFALTSPPLDWHGAVWLGLFGQAIALGRRDESNEPMLRSGFGRGWLFGLGANLVVLRFVPEVITRFSPLPMPAAALAYVLLACAQAIPWAIGGAVTAFLARQRALPSWFAYPIGIYVATFVPAVFPWTPAGGLTLWPRLIQFADVVGERGVSFFVAMSAGLAAHAVEHARAGHPLKPAFRSSAASAALLAALATYGHVRLATIERLRNAAPRARVMLVQPGFDAFDRWDESRAFVMIDRLTSLTRSAEARGSELTVWPESAYPFTLPSSARRSLPSPRAVLQAGTHGPVLTGAYMSEEGGAGYNSAILATSDGRLSKPYHKRHLLWFGETVPLADSIPWLRQVFARGTGLIPGRESVTFAVGDIRAAVLNCYEDTIPEAGREAMSGQPNLLVNITNDAWFEGSIEGELHLRLAILRAVEARRDFVRAVNKGPTSFIDATGRVQSRYELAAPGTLTANSALLGMTPTFYMQYGDNPLVFTALGAGAVAIVRRRRKANRSMPAARCPLPSVGDSSS